MNYLAPSIAAVLTTVSLAALLPLLRRRLVDVPNDRSSHSAPVPRGAGVAVMLGVVGGCMVGLLSGSGPSAVLLGGIVVMTAIGLLDDARGLGVGSRLVVTGVVALAVCWNAIDPMGLGAWSLTAMAVLFVVGYTNSFNFMDGINGISALNAVLAAAWFASLAGRHSIEGVSILALSVVGASVAFLPLNAPRAKVFLGDSGSYGLGATLAFLAVLLYAEGAPAVAVAAPLTVYVIDTAATVARRVVAGRRVGEAHREHVYQRLVDSGFSHLTVSALTVGFSAALCLLTLLIERPGFQVLAGTVVAIAYLALPRKRHRLAARATGSAT